MTTKFDQAAYWVNRHERYRRNVLSVGNESLDKEGNDRAAREFLKQLDMATAAIRPNSVLDVGCGNGRATPVFLLHGCRYTGVDISSIAIDDAKADVSGANFIVGDLNHWDTDQRFDLVAVLFVFIHFVDDDAWLSLLERCLKWVAPAGSLLIADRFSRQVEHKAIHAKTRPVGEYLPVFSKHGFALDKDFQAGVTHPGVPAYLRRALHQPR